VPHSQIVSYLVNILEEYDLQRVAAPSRSERRSGSIRAIDRAITDVIGGNWPWSNTWYLIEEELPSRLVAVNWENKVATYFPSEISSWVSWRQSCLTVRTGLVRATSTTSERGRKCEPAHVNALYDKELPSFKITNMHSKFEIWNYVSRKLDIQFMSELLLYREKKHIIKTVWFVLGFKYVLKNISDSAQLRGISKN